MARFYVSKLTFWRKSLQISLTVFWELAGFYVSGKGVTGHLIYYQKQQVTDLFFRPRFAFVIIQLKSRRVIHAGVIRSPTNPWVAQQLREATPYGQAPKYLIRDHDLVG